MRSCYFIVQDFEKRTGKGAVMGALLSRIALVLLPIKLLENNCSIKRSTSKNLRSGIFSVLVKLGDRK